MIIGIYKPKGPTSHDMIYRVRRVTSVKRVGHAGTLDPAASGVLVVGIGRESTKQLGTIVEHDKEYVATIRLGMTSSTGDGEGIIIEGSSPKTEVSRVQIDEVVRTFVGEIMQVPPIYSAIKMGGKKAYDMARQGKDVVMEPRKVVIHSIEVVSFEWPDLVIKVHCGKGVYIRSLARDIGEALGVGGYMAELERTRVGEFTLGNSLTIEALEKKWHETDHSTH
jgi:tRNA pseudouridine55 synthase